MKKRLKINGVIIFAAFLAIVFFPGFFFRHTHEVMLDQAMAAFGITCILLGQILRVSGRGYKAEHSQNSQALIEGGPYSLVRNPMYLGILLIGSGIVLALFKWWAICIFIFFFILRYLLLTFKEEKKLSLLFPQTYPQYCQRTPRLLPSLKMLLQADISVYLPLKLSWIKKEIGSILAVLLITLFIKSYKDIKYQGLTVYFKGALAMLAVIVLFIYTTAYLIRRTESPRKICCK